VIYCVHITVVECLLSSIHRYNLIFLSNRRMCIINQTINTGSKSSSSQTNVQTLLYIELLQKGTGASEIPWLLLSYRDINLNNSSKFR